MGSIETSEQVFDELREILGNAVPDLRGKRVLEFGCNDGLLAQSFLDSGVSVFDGILSNSDVHIAPRDGLTLFGKGIDAPSEIKQKTYDLVISKNALTFLSPTELDATLRCFIAHMREGACAILRTLMPDAMQTGSAGLLSGQERLPYCAATWAMAYHCSGFQVENLYRNMDDDARHDASRSFCDPNEVRTTSIVAVLRKPAKRGLKELFA